MCMLESNVVAEFHGAQSNAREWIWVIIASLLIVLLSSLPYLAGYYFQNTDQIFSGAIFDRQDYSVHLATMALGARGQWQYNFRFTSETHQGRYVKLGYIFLGHISRWLNLDLVSTYHLARLCFGLFSLLCLYKLAQLVFFEVYFRRLFFLLVALSSGLGWLQWIFKLVPNASISPIDFWAIDPYFFFGLMMFPHFMMSVFLSLGMICLWGAYLRYFDWWRVVLIVIMGASIQLIQPYVPILPDVAMVGAALGCMVRSRRFSWRLVGMLVLIGSTQVPLLIYNLGIFRQDTIWQAFATQNLTLSPPFVYYLWGFGLLWPLALVGIGISLQSIFSRIAGNKVQFNISFEALGGALLWVLTALLLTYLPWQLQRRFMFLFVAPLGIFAIFGLRDGIAHWLESRFSARLSHRRIGALLLVVFMSMSSLYLALGTSLYLSSRPDEFFDPASLVQTVDWLARHADKDDVVLSSERVGQLVAARTGLRVYIGHPIETLDYTNKKDLVQSLFAGEIDLDQLPACGCDWMIVGPYEHSLSDDIVSSYDLVYQNQSEKIYHISEP